MILSQFLLDSKDLFVIFNLIPCLDFLELQKYFFFEFNLYAVSSFSILLSLFTIVLICNVYSFNWVIEVKIRLV